MPYEVEASRDCPALIIYLVDASISMGLDISGQPRPIDLASDAVLYAYREIVARSTRSQTVSPRYKVATYAYNSVEHDVLEGLKTSDEILKMGAPIFDADGPTNTHRAFEVAENLLVDLLSTFKDGPAPIICHLTDGQFNGEDPTPVIERIRNLPFSDGAPLIENIYFNSQALAIPIDDPTTWPGVSRASEIADEYGRWLFEVSSEIPASYLEQFANHGYSMRPGSRLFFPGDQPGMMQAGFAMSTMTRVKR